MKLKTNLMLGGLVAASFLASCDNSPKGDEAQIQDKQQAAETQGVQYVVDTADSRVKFTGNGVGKNHKGKFKLTAGTVGVTNDQITGGDFTIDIRSMDLDEKGGMFDEKLRPHLMSGDFFDAEKFGTAKFEITNVSPYEKNDKDTSVIDGANFRVSGNLTLKDVTKNVSFPAKIDLDGKTLKAKANFDIDRREWQMNYGNDKTLKNNFISETVNIELDLQAEKQ